MKPLKLDDGTQVDLLALSENLGKRVSAILRAAYARIREQANEIERLRGLLERVEGFTEHCQPCPLSEWSEHYDENGDCTCGLDALEAEVRESRSEEQP